MVGIQYDRYDTFGVKACQFRRGTAHDRRITAGGLKGGGACASKSMSNSVKIGTTTDVFELEGSYFVQNKYRKFNLTDKIHEFLGSSELSILFLVGDSGSGKSFISQRINPNQYRCIYCPTNISCLLYTSDAADE